MDLQYNTKDGEWINMEGEVIVFDPLSIKQRKIKFMGQT